jgi:hypothetical protein
MGSINVYKYGLRLHRLAELIPWNRFLGSFKCLKILAPLAGLGLTCPDNASFPMTETPPPGYITDDGEGVASPGSHSSGESRRMRSFLTLFIAQFLGSRIKRYTRVRIFRASILNSLLFYS